MPAIGDRLSHYEILAKIGAGGMGDVFRAHDTSLERDVALKFLAENLRQDRVSRERFVREAKSAATLSHPNICVVHEALEVDGLPFIVMEYVEGESLKQRLEHGALPLEDAVTLAAQIADAMSAAHAQHIVHRDLKPANVMLTRTGHIKVMDFGLAKRALSATGTVSDEETVTGLTGRGTTVGTLAHMAPEQLLGRPVDHRADIFSFGIILYEMVTGQHPFKKGEGMSTAAAIVGDEPRPPTQHAPGIPKPLETLLAEMLAKAPTDRPPSMRAIHDRLKRILVEVQPRPEATGLPRLLNALGRSLRKPRVAIPAVAALLALVALGVWVAKRQARVRWAREVALPEIQRIVDANDLWRNLTPAYALAEQVEKIIPNDPKLAELFAQCSLKTTITTDPPGARVSMKEYSSPNAGWTSLGVTPLEKIRMPIGIFRWKFEKEGYETVEAAASTWAPNATSALKVQDMLTGFPITRVLDKHGSLPPGMVRVQGGATSAGEIRDFYIDKHEVTNTQYKAFIDGGGYRKKEYWQHAFLKDGKTLTWEDALREFVDQTGQPGPAQWQAGDYPDGQDEFPVSGISWYEAAAFAAFSKTSLPTGSHWGLARGEGTPLIDVYQLGGAAVFTPFSNFGGKGPVKVGTIPGITTYGASDMAGNVREWCWNETPKGRLLRGGAWDDNSYMFGNLSQAPPMDRSVKNGFRCALYRDPATVPAAVLAPVTFGTSTDFYKQPTVSDEIFRVYKEQFAYDKTELRPQVESRQEQAAGWIHETITFDAAYGRERIRAHLFLPRNVPSPYQTVVYFPGIAAVTRTSSQDIEEYYEYTMFLSFLVKNGRAVLFPVYKGTFERSDPALSAYVDPNESRGFSDYMTQVVKDLSRSIDYLETRQDIDTRKLAFYGMSWGGDVGPLVTAVDTRFKASVLLGGALYGRGRPEVNQFNYVTRVKTPTLMLGGRYDANLDTGIKPLFDLLGTKDKKLVLDETDHIPSTNMFIREILAWLDRELGPVKR